MNPEQLLDGLDEQQRQAAETLLGPVCMLAGAGTGKTRAITHRIAYGVASGVYPPGRVMALTFTSRAAGELRSRLHQLGVDGVSAQTFHAAALSQLTQYWPVVVGGSLPRIVDNKARIIAHAADSIGLKVDTATLRDAAAEIEWRKTSRMSLSEYERAADTRDLPPEISLTRLLELQVAYEKLKDERRQIDFEDVLLAATGMMEAESRVSQSMRESARFFVVDEYQDVSPLQQGLLDLWLGERNDLCVVGDASQTIYSFTGATPRYLLGFESRYPDSQVVRLEQNYRSSPQIVSTANRLMKNSPGALSLHSNLPARGASVDFEEYEHDNHEARSIAATITALIASGTSPSSISILYRLNAQSSIFEEALDDLGIPHAVHGAPRFFDLQEIKQAISLLQAASVTMRDEPLFKTVSDVLRSLLWTQDPPETRGAVRDRWESLNRIMTMADERPAGTTIRQFVADLREMSENKRHPEIEAVTLSTIHAAKGLEWDIVFVVGLSDEIMPINYAKTPEAVEEERRLLYVAVTRARKRLVLSWTRLGRRGGGRRKQSRFLAELQR